MALKPVCDYCKKELDAFGGILLSPPTRDGFVRKFHVCVTCYEGIAPTIDSVPSH